VPSRYHLPAIGQPKRSTLNPAIKDVLLKMEKHALMNKDSSRPSLTGAEIVNDLVNGGTINQFTERAFKITEMRQKLEIYKENRVYQAELAKKEIQARA
jgi:hypothetical protein